MISWRFYGLLVVAVMASATGCCFNCGPGFIEPSCGIAGFGRFEPSCGIAAAIEPDCGIAEYAGPAYHVEPDCGIAGYAGPAYHVEPDCGIATYEPDCGIIEPSCGFDGGYGGGYRGGCGFGCGYGLFGIWNGWGPDYQTMSAGWNPCIGPFEAIANAFRYGFGGCGWGWGCGFDYGGGCGSCYWDEWASDPPRCCDRCPNLCASSSYIGGGCGGDCGCGYGGGCGDGGDVLGGGYYGDVNHGAAPTRPNRAYAQKFHRWPRKPTKCDGDSCRVTSNERAVPPPGACNCVKCQARRGMARRSARSPMRRVPLSQSPVRQASYQR